MDIAYVIGWDVAKRGEVAVRLSIDEYSRELGPLVERCRAARAQPGRTQSGYSIVRSSDVGLSDEDLLAREVVSLSRRACTRFECTAGRGATQNGHPCN